MLVGGKMDVAVNFFELIKGYSIIHRYVVRIYPKDSKDPIADDLDPSKYEHQRFAIIAGFGEKRKKQRLLRKLFDPNKFTLFDSMYNL